MKILIYGLNYAPELTGTGKYTAEMAEALADAGHDVRVVCAPPYYPEWKVGHGYRSWRHRIETMRGVRVFRAPLWVPKQPNGKKRMLHLASFALASLPALAAHAFWRPEVVMTIAPSLANAPGALALARLTGARSWLHIQDYEVDAAFDLGLLKSDRAKKTACKLESRLLKRFDVVSSISDKMVERAIKKGVSRTNAFLLPNWVDTSAIFPLERPSEFRRELGIGEHTKVVLYSGNMGAKQGLEIVAEAAAAALKTRQDIAFVFCGNGATKLDLQKRCADLPNVRFMSLQPIERLNELLNLADIHVLPQRGDVADLVMPSKLTGMFASARAVIAMAQEKTELFEAVNKRGEVIKPECVDALVDAIEKLVANPALRANHGEAGRAYAQERLSPKSVFARLEDRLITLVGGRPPHLPGVRVKDVVSSSSDLARSEVSELPPLVRIAEPTIMPQIEKID
ncbi:Glycosyltransferase [Candidatus Burkholderia verschuerenii]|uniref:Glycosyltransferase n=1 Tax=Candidatus Burkholderia verschuerenii TaxID=242163 RepID=A0A0L0MEP4_9BURK|nr:glycosyltransferase WbuB [Candidatus Burkholderia verschuerenii]KND60808.1 Glycosyltransferase [Candidatus Burkholderia verschuerenii]